ncbi:MAG: histidine kinase dimerization/phosphoacceptor domain -containing protein [Leptolyngbya sp.]|nr:histidine kinase dimerization/phosphoacceptor domain -containing protein [Leptolyngbya sp.]
MSTSRSFVEQEAMEASRTMAQTVFNARDLYSESVVSRVKDLSEVTVTYDYENYPHGIPLPATFLLHLSESVEGIHSSMSFRYFSRYPFPWRQTTGGPRGTFEQEAITYLTQNPEQSFSRVESYQGQISLRYAVADRMKPTCVECHNTHPDSPKTDWQVGDMRGVLEVNYPLSELNESIQNSFNFHVIIILFTMGIGLAGLLVSLRAAIDREARLKTNVALKKLNQELEQRVNARTKTLELQQETLKLQDRAIMASSNGIIIVDARLPDNPTIFVNRAFETMTGYTAQEVIGLNCRILQGEDHDQPGLQVIRRALKRGSAAKVTVRNYRKDGSPFWNEISIAPIYDQGQLTHYIGIQQDVTSQIQSAEEAAQTNRLLDTICQAQSQFITTGNRLAIFEDLLTGLLELSNSEYGFIGEVLFRDDGYADIQDVFLKIRGVPYIKTHSITNVAWNEETQKFYEENYQSGMEFSNMNTLFGAVITTEEPVIANHPSTDPRRGGTPDGHPPLHSFLGLPLFSGQEIIGIVGVANRPNGYDQTVIDLLRPFLTTCSSLIEGYRLDRQRQQAEDNLKTSLNEKETLLKEIHHRVKNNLLVVSSLLSWQGEFSQDTEVLKLLEDSQNRLSTIALIHEKLYRSTDLSHIDLGEYISSLVQQIFATLSPQDQSIQLHCDCTSILVNIETASPCGLIVNELMTNVLEHAFPKDYSGHVTVTLQQDEQGLITLVVADDGVGFPDHFNYQETESLGWQLICLLTEQLEGNVSLVSPPGTRVVVTFSELAYRSRL